MWKGLFSLIQNVLLAKPFFKIIASIFKSTTSKINAYNFSSDLPQRTSNLQAFQHFTCSSFLVDFSSVLVHSLFSQGRSNRRQVTFLGYLYGAVVSFTWSCNSWTNASLSPVKCGERVTKAFTIYTQTKKNEQRS